jgi:hypothetical protein
MKIGDPDIYVVWTRCEDPGETPKWESQCGLIEQIEFGDIPVFHGFVGPERLLIRQSTSTFASIKHIIEKEYQKTHHLEWAYDDND